MTLTEPLAARPHEPSSTASTRLRASVRPRHAAPVAVLAVAGVLNTRALSQNGYANIFYSAGVKSMIRSWHNFFYLSFDPSGLVTMDKPPLGLWIQAASAKLFGFSPLSLLLPQAIAGVLAVAALYLIVLRRFGVWAAVASAATLALFPAFVAVSRDNNLDTPLVLLMVLACGGALRACETGRLRTLLWSAVLLALAFNTKALAAYLVLPGIAVAYLVCAPGTVRRHLAHLVAAGLLLGVLSVAWMVAVDATPAGQRPFVGGSANNSELSLTFAYNGLGRVKGQLGGPGAAPNLFVAPRVSDAVPSHPQSAPGDHSAPSVTVAKPSPDVTPAIDHTIVDDPIAFGKAPGALRLFKNGMGDQGAWLLPLALIGLIAIALTRPSRRDPRLAGLIVLGGFFLVEAVLLSVSGGIVHPYYLSALGPGCAAMVGCGTRAMADLRRRAGVVLATLAVVVSVVVQILLLHHDHYLRAWVPGLIALSSLAVLVTILRQHRMMTGLTLALAALLVAPAAYCLTTWSRPVESTFPAAGPRAVGGYGGAGVSPEGLAANRQLIGYVLEHGPGTRFQLLTQASVTAATPILLGLKAAAMGGYGGIDPALDGPGLGRLLASGQARYVLIGGGYDYLGGNGASKAAERACPQVPTQLWSPLRWASTQDLYLLDCKGMAAELERQPS